MKRSLHVPIARGRSFGAWVCLVALVLLWAPMWAAAWQANSMACCDGGLCAAHGHSKPTPSRPQKSSPAEAPMDCDHHAGSELTACAMTCSHESASSLTTA